MAWEPNTLISLTIVRVAIEHIEKTSKPVISKYEGAVNTIQEAKTCFLNTKILDYLKDVQKTVT